MALDAASLTVEEPTAVSTTGIGRSFDGRTVLAGIDLTIRRGEFVALLGHSGSGKSTLLRILARLDGGFTGGFEAPERPSVVFQDARLLPWAKVTPNVMLGLRGRDSREHADALLEEVGLAHRATAWPRELSGGEAQRAALARALIREPELLLMDEPFGALDALTRIKMHRLVKALCVRHNPAVLLVTHDVDEALVLADRILVLSDGRMSLDLPLDLPESGRRHDHRFPDLRLRLLDELGVVDDEK
jgi:sulfonate transport system ATP-binding protein